MEETDSIKVYSEEVRDVLSEPPKNIIRWGNTMILIFIIIILLLSWFVKYPDVILSEGIITTQIPPQKEYAKITGKINIILVKDNQIVSENTPLAILENTANYKDVFLLKSTMDTIKINTETFEFPLDSLPILFLGDIDTNYALFENNYLEYKLNKELQPFLNETSANKFSLSELRNRLKSLEAQKEISQSELSLKKKEIKRYENLYDKEVISAQELEDKQLEYFQAERSLKNLNVLVSQTKEAIINSNRMSRGTEISKTREEINLLKSVIQSFNQLKKSIKDWELQYVLKSKINGRVSFMNVWSKNQNITDGDLIFTIIPEENSSYIAKLTSPAQNSGKIKAGQTVNIKLENYPDTEFGMLKGKVKSISLIPNEEGYYFLDVSLPNKLITSYNKELEFKQEMRASAEIITEDIRLIVRFFYQLKEIFKE